MEKCAFLSSSFSYTIHTYFPILNVIPEPHLFLQRTNSDGVDFSLSDNVLTKHTDAQSWIPPLILGPRAKAVYFLDTIFACGVISSCKQLPIGHSEWVNTPSFQEPERSYMTLTTVGANVLVAGGRSVSTSKWQCKSRSSTSCIC